MRQMQTVGINNAEQRLFFNKVQIIAWQFRNAAYYIDIYKTVDVAAIGIAVGIGANFPLDGLRGFEKFIGCQHAVKTYAGIEETVGRAEPPRLGLHQTGNAHGVLSNSEPPQHCGGSLYVITAVAEITAYVKVITEQCE